MTPSIGCELCHTGTVKGYVVEFQPEIYICEDCARIIARKMNADDDLLYVNNGNIEEEK